VYWGKRSPAALVSILKISTLQQDVVNCHGLFCKNVYCWRISVDFNVHVSKVKISPMAPVLCVCIVGCRGWEIMFLLVIMALKHPAIVVGTYVILLRIHLH